MIKDQKIDIKKCKSCSHSAVVHGSSRCVATSLLIFDCTCRGFISWRLYPNANQ